MVVKECQICGNKDLEPILFLGYLPLVNKMIKVGERPTEQTRYPAELLFCPVCELVQLGYIVDKEILFPPEYPYTSSTTKILRDNFKELYEEIDKLFIINSDDLIVDIGSNDGNLLSNFKCRVLGITPEKIGNLAIERGIPTVIDYLSFGVVWRINIEYGKARFVTATNVFAHMDKLKDMMWCILDLLAPDGIFIIENHYLLSLIETLQYDTIYHEHLRYYSLRSLNYLLEKYGLEIIHAKRIPTHGGSIRVYASRKGNYPKFKIEEEPISKDSLLRFKKSVIQSKLELLSILRGKTIYGISAPSRGSTLINYAGIDDGILDCIVEVKGSYKIGNYIPGTLIPIVEESKLYEDQPEYALILSWHIADEIIKNLKTKGFKGHFIIPLPTPRII